MFSSMSFMFLGLMIKSLNHFELNFVWSIIGVLFQSSACDCAVFSSPFIENIVFDPLYILLS